MTRKVTFQIAGLVVAAVLIIVGILQIVAPPTRIVDGVNGPIQTIWTGAIWVGYVCIACGAALAIGLLSFAVKQLAAVFGQFASGVDWLVGRFKAPPLTLDLVISSKDGVVITLGDWMKKANQELKSLRDRLNTLSHQVSEVDFRTSHIQPPPPPAPPKSHEETIAEQNAMLAKLTAQLAELKAASVAVAPVAAVTAPVVPVAVAAPKTTEGIQS